MPEKMQKITERTLVPISLLSVVVGVVIWLTNLSAQTNETMHKLDEISRKQELYLQTVQNIDMRLSHIEGKLEVDK